MTTLHSIRLFLATAIVGPVLFLATATPAAASCAMPRPIENEVATADIVFVGSVTSTSNGDRWAEVAVQEIWRGPDLPATVVIQGGPGGNTMTSVDRSFVVGTTYLFFPFLDQATGTLTDNACSSTTAWSQELARLRPASIREATPGDGADVGGFDLEPLLPIGVALLVFGALLAVGLLARGRQET